MLEHVDDPKEIIKACLSLLKPNGSFYRSTLNRNLKSFVSLIVGAEYLLNMVPKGTHSYSKFIKLMGPSGSGQLTKMVNQITITGLIQSLAEAIYFSEKAGLDTQQVIEVISKGAAQSWQMENRWKTMVEGKYNHGFAVDLMRKDLKIAIEEGSLNGASLELTKQIDKFYEEIQSLGGGRWDTSSLLERIKRYE